MSMLVCGLVVSVSVIHQERDTLVYFPNLVAWALFFVSYSSYWLEKRCGPPSELTLKRIEMNSLYLCQCMHVAEFIFSFKSAYYKFNFNVIKWLLAIILLFIELTQIYCVLVLEWSQSDTGIGPGWLFLWFKGLKEGAHMVSFNKWLPSNFTYMEESLKSHTVSKPPAFFTICIMVRNCGSSFPPQIPIPLVSIK
jgi:hypothetical protein